MGKLYPWQSCYQDALLELDADELRVKIGRAVAELEKRSQELVFSQDSESLTERQAIADAFNGLEAIRRHELAMPFDTGGQMRPITA